MRAGEMSPDNITEERYITRGIVFQLYFVLITTLESTKDQTAKQHVYFGKDEPQIMSKGQYEEMM